MLYAAVNEIVTQLQYTPNCRTQKHTPRIKTVKTIFALTIAAIALSGCSAHQRDLDLGFKMPPTLITMKHKAEALAVAAKIEAESKWHSVAAQAKELSSFLQYAPSKGPCDKPQTITLIIQCAD
jgi:hypothetical protein